MITRFIRHLDPVPLLGVLKSYSRGEVKGDLQAGLNTALLAFPQGIAYASIAGLPIQYGIFGSIMAALVSPWFSGSRFITPGPTNATAAMVLATFPTLGLITESERALGMPLVLLMVGSFLICGALLQVANLIQYVSRSVVTGYITAAAVYIIVNQVPKVLGLTLDVPPGSNILALAWYTVAGLGTFQLSAILISALTLLCYLAIKRFRPHWPVVAVVLLVLSCLHAGLDYGGVYARLDGPVAHASAIQPDKWALSWPVLNPNWTDFGLVALTLSFLIALESISIGKTIAARSGQRLDGNQEILGLGFANIFCGLYQGMPAGGSLTRSQLNWSSGARTGLSNVYSGLICLVGALTLGQLTGFIPIPVLGVLVITIGISLINRKVIRVVWNTTNSDRTVYLVTVFSALTLRLDFAIILGTATSILLFLRKAAQPELMEYGQEEAQRFAPEEGQAATTEIAIVHVEGALFFGAAELFRDQMRRVCERQNQKVVILKLRNAHHLDATSVLALEELIRYMQETNRQLLISEVRDEAMRIFRNSRLLEVIGEDNVFADDANNPTLSTSLALRRAMKLLDGEEAEVKIFVGGSHRHDEPQPAPQEKS
ncbi:MAG: sulfate transporter [Puniceicoccaceae bacterium 5H]|nr:MAG: sulfate transporter [Puniceicoccaceae bacterium 5H]